MQLHSIYNIRQSMPVLAIRSLFYNRHYSQTSESGKHACPASMVFCNMLHGRQLLVGMFALLAWAGERNSWPRKWEAYMPESMVFCIMLGGCQMLRKHMQFWTCNSDTVMAQVFIHRRNSRWAVFFFFPPLDRGTRICIFGWTKSQQLASQLPHVSCSRLAEVAY
jgi:hypothetical protein